LTGEGDRRQHRGAAPGDKSGKGHENLETSGTTLFTGDRPPALNGTTKRNLGEVQSFWR
jgi:hypothetical protein